uniref:Pre-rRNA-processing protein esf2 n=1 Tax=Anthurium amnicola TaxID=1678845 RepID=A0A1D1XT81_9ARAE
MGEEEDLEKEREVLNGMGECKQRKRQGAEDYSNEKKEKKKTENKGMKGTIAFDDGGKRGICYLSRIPPHMDPTSLRHMLSQYGEIERIYLAPTDPSAAKGPRKRPGSTKKHAFSEGWVEFAKKSVAKRVANMLNGEQIGGRRRSPFYYDIWNIKYLSNFTWGILTEEIAYKKATREQKLALEISAAKRERNYTISKFAQARALNAIEERRKKKHKTGDPESSGNITVDHQEAKIFRRFRQNNPFDDNNQNTGTLSKDILAEVFGNSLS